MTYTVLARRYRSKSFDELIGQEPIARTLRNAISAGRVAHAYLFCGTRGVGKTSSARLFAVALNGGTPEVDAAIMAGGARWGDGSPTPPHTRGGKGAAPPRRREAPPE